MIYTFFKELHIVFIYFYRKYVLFLNVRPFTFFQPVFCLVNYFVLISSPFFPCKTRKHTFNCIWCTDDTPQCTSLCSTYFRVVWLQTSGILFPYFNTHTHTQTAIYILFQIYSPAIGNEKQIYIYISIPWSYHFTVCSFIHVSQFYVSDRPTPRIYSCTITAKREGGRGADGRYKKRNKNDAKKKRGTFTYSGLEGVYAVSLGHSGSTF